MKKLLLLLAICISLPCFAQESEYIFFENSGKNKALFDYSDPYSLVSLIKNNVENNFWDFLKTDNMPYGEYNGFAYPFFELKEKYILGDPWVMEVDGQMYLTRRDSSRSPEEYLDNLLANGTPDYGFMGSDFEIPIGDLRYDTKTYDLFKEQWFKANLDGPIYLPNKKFLYDCEGIEALAMKGSTMYFLKKTNEQGKFGVVLKLYLDDLTSKLELHESLMSKEQSELLQMFKAFQLEQKQKGEESKIPRWFYYDNLPNEYKKGQAIYTSVPGEPWLFYLTDGSQFILTRPLDESITADQYLNDLLTNGSLDNFKTGEEFVDGIEMLRAQPDLFDRFKTQYAAAQVGESIRDRDRIFLFWVEEPKTNTNINSSIELDSACNCLQVKPKGLVVYESFDNPNFQKQGNFEESSPRALMAFNMDIIGYSIPCLNGSDKLHQDIKFRNFEFEDEFIGYTDDMKVFINNYKKGIKFKWYSLLQKGKGKKMSQEELNKICFPFPEGF